MKVVSDKYFCTVLEKHERTLDRVRGSHHIYTKVGSSVILTVPVHGNRDLKRGTQRKLMKDAGLTDAEL